MLCCFLETKKQSAYLKSKNRYHSMIKQRLSNDECQMLKLIFRDLANRHNSFLLTYTNFLLFFGLHGLWGAKLFHKFDEDERQLITEQQFLYGMSCTAKAKMDQKIHMLYTFLLEGDNQQGISFNQFRKMLYNYSKNQLKKILLQDGIFVQQITQAIAIHAQDNLKQVSINLDHHQEIEQDTSMFSKKFKQSLGEYKYPGTCFEIVTNNTTYHINYCNMISLIRQFTLKIWSKFELNRQQGKLSYHNFQQWIKIHMHLFNSYYSAFHNNLWQYIDGEPRYLLEGKIEKISKAQFQYQNHLLNICVLLVDDALILNDDKIKTILPKTIKIICLQGLTITKFQDQIGYGMKINHDSDNYQPNVLYFQNQQLQEDWLRKLKIYQSDILQRKYNIGEVIGSGKFSIVYKCRLKQNFKANSKQENLPYALKVIQIEKLDDKALNSINNESQILKIVKHPQIIGYRQTITTRRHIYIIQQYVNGQDLFEYVRARKQLGQYQSAFIIGQIMQAVSYLHSMQILHRDLKPENIMVMYKDNVKEGKQMEIKTIKIIDFGFSNHVSLLKKLSKSTVNGTPNYLSPEVLLGNPFSYKADIFAIGSILYFLLSGKLAFKAFNQEQTMLKTIKGDYQMEGQLWSNISYEAKDLILKMLKIDPQKRLSLQQAKNHNWFSFVKQKIHQQ